MTIYCNFSLVITMHIADNGHSSIKDVKNVKIYLAVFSGEKILIHRTRQNSSREGNLWQLPSFCADVCGIESNYIDAIMNEANNALKKNVCMEFSSVNNYELIPVWLEGEEAKELSFIITIPCETLKISSMPGAHFASFNEGIVRRMLGFFSKEDVQNLEVDPKVRLMITKAFCCRKT